MGNQNRLFRLSVTMSPGNRPRGGRLAPRTEINPIPAMTKTTITRAYPKPLSPPVPSISLVRIPGSLTGCSSSESHVGVRSK
jgi:hypothetical protein